MATSDGRFDVVELQDVTLRDGGYVNGHAWSSGQAARIVETCGQAGVRYIEVGYYRPDRHRVDGDQAPAASSPPHYLAAMRAQLPDGATMVSMVHMKDVQLSAYKDLATAGVGMVRLPARISTIGKVGPHVAAVRDAGMRVSVNLIRVSELSLDEIAQAAAVAAASNPDVFCVADSNGSLFPEQAAAVAQAAQQGGGDGMAWGFHAHDGLSLAFADSLAAFRAGCTYLDASLRGMGKGGGNLSLELIAGFLRTRTGRPLDLALLARTSAEVLAPWLGASRPTEYESVISGLLNLNIDEIAARRGPSDDWTALLSTAPERSTELAVS